VKPATEDIASLRSRFRAAGQEHVLAAWERLEEGRRARLLRRLAGIDLARVAGLARLIGRGHEAGERFEPPEVVPAERSGAMAERAREARRAGAADLAAGRVAFVLVAGGQGSRLGFEGPKGLYPVGPVSGWPLYELLARKLRAAAARHGFRPLWLVMTSEATDAATREFFARRGHFGLDPEDVVFFEQGTLPALDARGRIVMAAEDEPFLAPTGHGGVLEALARHDLCALAAERGVERFSYFQVDNPLVRPADPLFLGLHALARAEMSSKVVSRTDPDEKVGVIGRVDGRLTCIEYSDLPEELRHAREAGGALRFRAGNVAMHVLERTFVERLTRGGRIELPWHVAHKRMPAVDERGRATEVEGYKFETFVFDALREARSSATLEVLRDEEFSPVKNVSGPDSPGSARRDQCRLFASWVRAAGLELPPPDPEGVRPVEVDPLLAESVEELRAAAPEEPERRPEGHLWGP
jgi:UDP-N-acetylglucosamine/UDP-N-acetylgalactosamine diphosphorylase